LFVHLRGPLKGHFKALLGRLDLEGILVGVHAPWKLDSVGFDIDRPKALAVPLGGVVSGFVSVLGEVDGLWVVCLERFDHLVCEATSAVGGCDVGKAVTEPGEGVDQGLAENDFRRGETLGIPDPLVRPWEVEMVRVSFGKPFGDFAAVNFRYLPRLIDNGDDDTAPEMLMAAAFAEDSNIAQLLADEGPVGSVFGGELFPKGPVGKTDLKFRDYFFIVDSPLLEVGLRCVVV